MEHYDTQHNGTRQYNTQHNNKKSGKQSIKCCFDEYHCPECPVSIVILIVVMLCVFMPSGIASALGPPLKVCNINFYCKPFLAEHFVLCFHIFYCDAEYRTVERHCAECHNAPWPNVIFIFASGLITVCPSQLL